MTVMQVRPKEQTKDGRKWVFQVYYKALDNTNKKYCMELLRTFCKQKAKTLIFATHQKEEIPSFINLNMQL